MAAHYPTVGPNDAVGEQDATHTIAVNSLATLLNKKAPPIPGLTNYLFKIGTPASGCRPWSVQRFRKPVTTVAGQVGNGQAVNSLGPRELRKDRIGQRLLNALFPFRPRTCNHAA